ncbi:MAG: PPP family 3-phenylpropionic acid transporter [Sulfurimonas sp.]|jgi:PPP family 3-phenylpropionic acid transporter|uniref:MFS transporter n=1 Tax=Sulfurimonas sp. TaxID=2022749 RepID=UPI0039E2A614
MPILLSTFYFFYFAIIGVYIIFMPKVLAMSGYSASEIGIIFAAGPLVRFILPFAFIKGLKIDLKSFNFALAIMLLSAVSFYFSLDSFYKLLFSNIGLGIGLSVILPYIEVISLSVIGKERYGKVRLFGSVGFVLVALVLVKYLSAPVIALNYLLLATGATAVIAFVIVLNAHAKRVKKEEIKNDINLLADWKLWLGLTLMQVSFGSFYNFFTIYETDFGVSLDMTIYLWSFGVIMEIVMLFSQGRFLQNNLLTILQITTFASAIRWFLVYAFPQDLVVLFFSQSLHALSFALFHSAAISYLFHTYKHQALAQQFFSGITYGLGGFSGALLAGYIYEIFPRELFLSSALIAFLAFVSLRFHAQRSKGNS